ARPGRVVDADGPDRGAEVEQALAVEQDGLLDDAGPLELAVDRHVHRRRVLQAGDRPVVRHEPRQVAAEPAGPGLAVGDEALVRLPQRLTRRRLAAKEPAGQAVVTLDALELPVVMRVDLLEAGRFQHARVTLGWEADDAGGTALLRGRLTLEDQ